MITVILSGLYVLNSLNKKYSIEVPLQGGTYTEGIVGYARFINPVLAYSDADKDMISLIYAGLLKPSSEGKLVANLADSWNISPDGLTYTVTLKPNLIFHDGSPLTTDDVEFTIEKIKDLSIKSPKADVWNGVKVEKIDAREIKFSIKKPFAPFLENLTFGILPKHIWKDVEPQAFDVSILNREPIGSGPFKVRKTEVDASGIYQNYDLVPFDSYVQGKPYIEHFIVKFFKNENDALDAYTSGSIDGLGGISPESATKLKNSGYEILSTSLPRVFAVFFNQNNAPVLTNKEVRKALNESVDRSAIIQKILNGWGSVENGAIPENLSSQETYEDSSLGSNPSEEVAHLENARKILADKGWKMGTDNVLVKETKTGKKTETVRLSFSISTSNIPELKATAELLKDTWTKLGANVTVQIFEPSDLTQKVIRPRRYDSLLFGNVIGRDLDLFPFWHSSERTDPGLNIALYTNIKADKALEVLRTTSDESKRIEAFKAFSTEVTADIPAVFLYSPGYIYATNGSVRNLQFQNMTSISERFMHADTWYIDTERVWKFFIPQKN
jgi:peptide/nickel transport system substrate-binding protein